MANGSVVAYGLVVIGKTLATKMIFASYHFGYPIMFSLLSCLTTLLACVLIFASGKSEYAPFPTEHIKGFAVISLLTASDMGLTNWAVALISVALQLTIKAAIPAIVVTYEKFALHKSHTTMAYLSLVPLVFGAVLVGMGSGKADFDLLGVCVMCGATVCSSIKMVSTHGMIRAVKKDMGMVAFLFWLELAMIPILLPWCVANGELSDLPNWSQVGQLGAWMFVISIFLFHTQTSFMMNCGIFISLVGYGAYSYQSGQSKAASAAKALAAKAQPPEGDEQSGGAYPVYTAHSENTGLLVGSNGLPNSVPVSLL